MTDLTTSQRLEWLVDSRSKIQHLSLTVLSLIREGRISEVGDTQTQRIAALLVGGAFSLWRAVFLSHPSQPRQRNLDAAAKYLERVIEHNAIGYGDDDRMRGWAFGYYTNNLFFRISRLREFMPELGASLDAAGILIGIEAERSRSLVEGAQEWDAGYKALELAVACFEARCASQISN